MAGEVVERWLTSGRNAMINRQSLKPIEHHLLKGKPLSSKKGQAETFFLVDDRGTWCALKKFHGNRTLDRTYLDKIGALLPRDAGFACGTQRQVLSQGALWKTWGFHYSKDLDRWLDGTILMPRIEGLDWAGLADEIRDGRVTLDRAQRVAICRDLTTLIESLEGRQCCHRDLSCGNVFIDPQTLRSYLIDFDSIYHPSLTMPQGTTCGTTGYTAHLAWSSGQLDASRTWCEHADRYALAILNVEFMLVDANSPMTNEGGIFDQQELCNQGGRGVDSILRELQTAYPGAAQLLESALQSTSFDDCPAPSDWTRILNVVAGPASKPPGLAELATDDWNRIASILAKRRVVAPLWPAPDLSQMSQKPLCLPKEPHIQLPQVALPPDPWAK